jgi:hypothetical protein
LFFKFNISIIAESMLKLTSSQLKAIFLCIVFASNTIAGFACAVGVNAALIKHLIHISNIEEGHASHVHLHANGEKHHHHNEKEASDEDGCCNSHVISFEHLDKIIATSVSVDCSFHLFELPTSLFLNTALQSAALSSTVNYLFRSLSLPTEDIRVSIRSFQI